MHRDDCPAFADLRRQATEGRLPALEPAEALYRVVDALADSFFPELSKLDDRIDALEDGVLKKPDDAQLQQVFKLKRRLVSWRKVISPERDLFARLFSGGRRDPRHDARTSSATTATSTTTSSASATSSTATATC